MDPHIEELFEKAPPFFEGELSFRPDYDSCSTAANMLENMMMECFGREAARLMGEYTAAQFEVERFYALHYFYQGYLAAKAELEQKKGLTLSRNVIKLDQKEGDKSLNLSPSFWFSVKQRFFCATIRQNAQSEMMV